MEGLDVLLVDGKLTPATGGATFPTVDPTTEVVLGVAADATPADLDAAVAAARRVFDETSWPTDVAFRVRCLRQLHDALAAHTDELRALTVAEVGAPVFLTSGAQLEAPVADLGWVADLAEAYDGWREDLGRAEPMGIPSHRWLLREPAGVVGAITPWNFPHQLNLAKVGPALAAGCTVVLKPAPDTPWCGAALARLAAEETDLPPGAFNVVTGADHRLGAQLAADPRVDLLSFTGSTATGRRVMATAAERVARVFLELGASRPSWSSTTPTWGPPAPWRPSPRAPTPARGAPSPPGWWCPGPASTRRWSARRRPCGRSPPATPASRGRCADRSSRPASAIGWRATSAWPRRRAARSPAAGAARPAGTAASSWSPRWWSGSATTPG